MALTPVPSLDRTSATFKTDVDTFFVSVIPTMVSELSALQIDVEANQTTASTAASNALTSETNAEAAAITATAALAAVSAAMSLTTVAVPGTSQAASASNLYVVQNAATTTITLPASPANGAVVGILIANDRIDNVIARNGKQIQGISEDLTVDNANASLSLRYVDATSQWRIV